MPRVSLPTPNLIVIRSADVQRSVAFYESLGLTFTRHRHGGGPEHFAAESDGFVFEIYPRAAEDTARDTSAVRLGFRVADMDSLVDALRAADADVITEPTDSEWGRRAVVRDPDGHTLELLTPVPSRTTSQRIGDLLRATRDLGGSPPDAQFVKSDRVLPAAMQAAGEWTTACEAALADELRSTPAVDRWYDLLVRLVHGTARQAEPLVEGRGNFGGVCVGHPDHPPALPRFTEVRLTARGLEVLNDTKTDT